MKRSRVDHLIVGAGVYGAATAWHLARSGAEVVLIDAGQVASGASGGVGKRGVRANGRDLRELPLMRIAHGLWPTLESELGGATGWKRVGHLRLYERAQDEVPSAHRAAVQSDVGIPTHHLSAEEVRALEPGLSDVVRGALHVPLDGIADHTMTTKAYAAAAKREGVQIREGVRVVGFEVDDGRARSVRTSEGRQYEIAGDLLLLCNTAVPEIVRRSVGRRLPVWTVFPQAMTTAPLAEPPFGALCGHAHRAISLKMLADGRVMASGGWRGVPDPDGRGAASDPAAIRGNWAEAVRLLPALHSESVETVSVERAESMSMDDIPIIDRLPEASNVLIGCGWSGHGWAIAPAVAPLLADWVLSGQRPAPLRPFTLDRFSPGAG